MKLLEWREQNGKTQQDVADAVGTSQASVDRWEKGAIPRKAAMAQLVKLTAGAVTYRDFFEGEAAPKRKSRDPAINTAASRKAAATVRRQREARA